MSGTPSTAAGAAPAASGSGAVAPAARARASTRPPGLASRAGLGVLGLAVVALAWWLCTAVLPAEGAMARRFAPGPTLSALAMLLTGPDLPAHILVSLRRIAVGLGLALAVGVPLGLAIGSFRRLEAALSPAMQFLRMISPLSWMPIAVMAFGVGDDPVYFLLAFAAVWPIVLNTAAGVHHLDPRWLLLAQSVAATRWETLRHVILPGVLGHILTGLRLAIGILWIVLVPCEMLGVSAGMGYFILDTRDRLAYPELMAMVLLIGLLGFLLDARRRGRCIGAGAVRGRPRRGAFRDSGHSLYAMAPPPRAPAAHSHFRHEPMTISTLVQLIGHTSASAALQDCMLGLGMKKMPRATRPPGCAPRTSWCRWNSIPPSPTWAGMSGSPWATEGSRWSPSTCTRDTWGAALRPVAGHGPAAGGRGAG